MGLKWTKPFSVKRDTILLTKCVFPEEVKDDIWNLWKIKKADIKSDGFSIGKDRKTNEWNIQYWHTKNDNSYEPTDDGPMWKHERDAKVKKWNKKLEKARQVFSEKNEVDVDEMD